MLFSSIEQEVRIDEPSVVHYRWHACGGNHRDQNPRECGESGHMSDIAHILQARAQ